MHTNTKLIIGNMKMHSTTSSFLNTAHKISEAISDTPHTAVICPPYTSLWTLQQILRNTKLHLGAQDLHHEDSGSFTGEISALMLLDAGCRYVLIGHSERRRHHHQTDELIHLKLQQALHHGLNGVLCIGESLQEKESGKSYAVITKQLEIAISGLSHKQDKIIIAYEPLWAIGQDAAIQSQDLAKMQAHIHKTLKGIYGNYYQKEKVQIIYGGSVTSTNIKEIYTVEGIQGVLVGRACLDPQSFITLINTNAET